MCWKGPAVIIEECFQGRDYRVLVVGGKLVAASERVPAHVVGDGTHTVAELVEIANQDPRRGDGHDQPLTKIEIDEAAVTHLARSGLVPDAVPADGEPVFLRATANLSTGGTARDVTAEVHPATARMCERAARVIGLDVCGLDLVIPDIGRPLPPRGAGVIEVNAAPGLRMHHHPSEGKPRDAGGAIVDMLFPRGATGRIPLAAVTGTNGKTTVTRMIAAAVEATGKCVGMTTSDGISIGGHVVTEGDDTGHHSARAVLMDPAVEVAVLETARGGIVKRGLAWDWADVGVMTNIQADHLGQDGIRTVDDLLNAKMLVAERVREGGTIVLNAEDERLATLPDHPRISRLPRQIVFFALDPANPVVSRHLAAGGTAYFARGGWLVESVAGADYRLVRVAAIPAALGGLAEFQVANALAAAAACRALGLSRTQVAAALAMFGRGGDDNAGRMNLFRARGGYVVLDYGHNPAAFAAIGALAARWPGPKTAVVTCPGDRSDETIDAAAREVVRAFDRVIFREDEDRRGRQPGEVAARMCRAAREAVPGMECRIVLDEERALTAALNAMHPGELVFHFYEHRAAPLAALHKFGATPADALTPPRPGIRVDAGEVLRPEEVVR